jgi:hypothetical protein
VTFLAAAVLLLGRALAADPAIVAPPGSAASALTHQELMGILAKRLPGQTPDALKRASADFLAQLRETSPIIAEDFEQGRLSQDEIASRLDVFIGDHPEYTGQRAAAPVTDPRQRIADLLRPATDLIRTGEELDRLVDRFLNDLGNLSGTAKEDLLAGRMAQSDLQTRVSVFLSDLRAEAAKTNLDPAEAAAGPIVDSYLKATFGSASERMNSICYRGTVDDMKTKSEFVTFRMRPNLLRIHVVKDGLVIRILAYDGNQAWAQAPGRMPVSVTGLEALAVARSADFDDPLMGYKERGAKVRLLAGAANEPYQIQILEAGGAESVVMIDRSSYTESAARRRRPDGKWNEVRFEDYRTVGTTKVAFRTQEWSDGVLRATTQYSEVRVDPGIISNLFRRPGPTQFAFMDLMEGEHELDLRESKAAHTPAPKAVQ